jgi:hypothetical protein
VCWPLSASCFICSAVRSNGPNDRKELAVNVAAISAKVRTKKAALVQSGFLSGAAAIWKGAIFPNCSGTSVR